MGTIIRCNFLVPNLNFTSDELVNFLKILDNSDLVYYVNDFLESALKHISKHVEQFNGEDWCLIFYLMFKYVIRDLDHEKEFEKDLIILKESIKLTYMI